MKDTRTIMGMPVTVEIPGGTAVALESVFAHFVDVDQRFSTYKHDSEISRINRGEITLEEASDEMLEIFKLADDTRMQTAGYFDIHTPQGAIDPSGIVKGWAIKRAARLIEHLGFENYWVDAGGDVQTAGFNAKLRPWRVGIRSPFDRKDIVKIIVPRGRGIATSGTYMRGAHIYNPHAAAAVESPLVSLTVIAHDVYEADRFATAAFAMGSSGIHFVEKTPGLEAYTIDRHGIATMTMGLITYAE
jgi:thiamine biosynthesis lipoprotein